jgi:ATP-dependent Clp protease, protease subunit
MKNRFIKLAQLAAQNPPSASPLRVVAGADEAHVYVYDVIGEWFGGVSAQQFARDLQGIRAATVHLHINSPGGDVFDARAMVSTLLAHPSTIVAHVEGLAASAASYLMLGADRVDITDGAFVMIHNAWGVYMGNRHELRREADVLEKIDNSIIADYLRKAGGTSEEWQARMDAETWLTAAEALELKLVDAVVEAGSQSPDAPEARNWNLSAYEHVPAALQKAAPPVPPPAHTYNRAQMERRLSLLECTSA